MEIDLVSLGEADAPWPSPVDIRWTGAPLLAADGLAGYRLTREGERQIRLRRSATAWDRPLRPGERRQVGWLRFAGAADVEVILPPS
jgi:hypothetical protein